MLPTAPSPKTPGLFGGWLATFLAWGCLSIVLPVFLISCSWDQLIYCMITLAHLYNFMLSSRCSFHFLFLYSMWSFDEKPSAQTRKEWWWQSMTHQVILSLSSPSNIHQNKICHCKTVSYISRPLKLVMTGTMMGEKASLDIQGVRMPFVPKYRHADVWILDLVQEYHCLSHNPITVT